MRILAFAALFSSVLSELLMSTRSFCLAVPPARPH